MKRSLKNFIVSCVIAFLFFVAGGLPKATAAEISYYECGALIQEDTGPETSLPVVFNPTKEDEKKYESYENFGTVVTAKHRWKRHTTLTDVGEYEIIYYVDTSGECQTQWTLITQSIAQS